MNKPQTIMPISYYVKLIEQLKKTTNLKQAKAIAKIESECVEKTNEIWNYLSLILYGIYKVEDPIYTNSNNCTVGSVSCYNSENKIILSATYCVDDNGYGIDNCNINNITNFGCDTLHELLEYVCELVSRV